MAKGSIISRALERLFPATECRVLFLGLDASGRTTLLYKLKLGEVVTTIPTIGFNVETVRHKGIDFTIWDVGGCDKIRPLWRHYFVNTSIMVFFINGNDTERTDESVSELVKLNTEEGLTDIPCIILFSKRDLYSDKTAALVRETEAKIGRLIGSDRPLYSVVLSGTTGEGIKEFQELMYVCASEHKAATAQPKSPTGTTAKNTSSTSTSTADGHTQLKDVRVKENDAANRAGEAPPHANEELLEQWLTADDEDDDEFIRKLRDFTLEKWDHRTHLRIAWLHLTRHGRREGMKLIFDDIRAFIENSPRTTGRPLPPQPPPPPPSPPLSPPPSSSSTAAAPTPPAALTPSSSSSSSSAAAAATVPSLPSPPSSSSSSSSNPNPTSKPKAPPPPPNKSRGTTFHSTLTYCFAHIVHWGLASQTDARASQDFKTFLLLNPQLSNFGIVFSFYTKAHLMNNLEARVRVVLPDKRPLPSIVTDLNTLRTRKTHTNLKDPTAKDPTAVRMTSAAAPQVDNDDKRFLASFRDRSLSSWGHPTYLRVCYLLLAERGLGAPGLLNQILDDLSAYFGDVSNHVTRNMFWCHMVWWCMAKEAHPRVRMVAQGVQRKVDLERRQREEVKVMKQQQQQQQQEQQQHGVIGEGEEARTDGNGGGSSSSSRSSRSGGGGGGSSSSSSGGGGSSSSSGGGGKDAGKVAQQQQAAGEGRKSGDEEVEVEADTDVVVEAKDPTDAKDLTDVKDLTDGKDPTDLKDPTDATLTSIPTSTSTDLPPFPTFEAFSQSASYRTINDPEYIGNFYSDALLTSAEAVKGICPPDVQPLPSLVHPTKKTVSSLWSAFPMPFSWRGGI